MPPAAKKDCSVILYDLKAQNAAKQALVKICCNNFFANSKDLTKLILLNSSVTDNQLNARYDGYNNINEISKDITVYNPETMLEQIETSETGNANWLEGLYVALKNLQDEFQDIAGIVTHQVLFLTDLNTPLGDYDHAIVDKIKKIMKKLNAFLYVVGPEVEVPFTIKSEDHVRQWMKDFNANSENLKVLKKIFDENSVVCSYKMGVHLFFGFRRWRGTQPWNVPLEIGNKIKIPAKTMKVLDTDVKCKLKKLAGNFRKPTWVDAEDETVEFDFADVRVGISRHDKFVQMPETKMFQVQNPRSFSVLCFTDSKNVPEYLMRGEACYRCFANSPSGKNKSFNILVDCLAKQNKYVIARRIYNNNYAPKIVVLIPKPDHQPKCFLLTALPFNENIRVNYKEGNVEAAPKMDPCTQIYDFLDAINIDEKKSQKKMPLAVNMLRNFKSQRIINKGADKLLDKQMKLDEVDTNILEVQQGPEVEVLAKIWPERVLAEEKKKKEVADDDGSDNDFDW